jgi:hypothetical protein
VQGEPLPPRSLRLALVASGLLALLAIVAVASRTGFGSSSRTGSTPGYVSYAFSAFLIVFVLAIPVALYTLFLRAREGTPSRPSLRSRLLANALTILFFGLVVLLAFYIRQHHGHLPGLHPRAAGKGPLLHEHARSGPRAGYEPKFEWTVLWVALALLAAAAAWLFVSYRRRPRRPPPAELPSVGDDVAASISDAIDDLEAEPDARRAVIAAYARMEGALAQNGLRRRPSDTPVEYLRRVLGSLTSRGEAVGRLTALFERAKFSPHEISAPMKLEAIAALREIRDDLERAPA